jgi:NADH/F420H2 dehydrogenase subunit C
MKIKIYDQLKNIVPILAYQRFVDESSLVVSRDKLLFALQCLKTHFSYRFCLLSSIAGVDLLEKEYRFSVVYDLLSLTYNSRLRVKVFVNEVTSVPSVVPLYINANWWEREVWDMYGVYFQNHPDLRRILTDYGFEGHPLRKDFPLYGYVEVRYDEGKKRVVAEPVQLTQEFRAFTFQTPW